MRQQIDYNKPVGIRQGKLYIAHYTFEDSELRGVTGSILEPMTQDKLDKFNSTDYLHDYYREIWKGSVGENEYEGSLEEFIDEGRFHEEGDFPGHDLSDLHLVPDEIKSQYFKDAATFDCVGGGRCFYKDMKWDVVLDAFLVDEINRLENEPAHAN